MSWSASYNDFTAMAKVDNRNAYIPTPSNHQRGQKSVSYQRQSTSQTTSSATVFDKGPTTNQGGQVKIAELSPGLSATVRGTSLCNIRCRCMKQ